METFTTTSRTVSNPSFFQLFVKLIGGQTAVLNFTTPDARAFLIKQRIFEITKIPIHLQRLISSGHQLHDDSIVSSPESTIHLCLRLRGGKGGFGSLLRGAATKAGQKKTNNFDACRDMSGRRLRHVNAEKKLEEWRAEEEERRLEKIAEEFIQKAAKKGKKGVGEGVAEKYVEKYREESAKCVERVEMSVREAVASCGNLKRKSGAEPRADAKKLKIWMGKRKLGENDSNDEDEASSDDDEENEKSAVSDGPIHGGLTREVAGSSDSVTGGGLDAEGSGSSSYSSGSGDEKESTLQVSSESGGCSGGEIMPDEKSALVDPVTRGCTTVKLLESALVSDPEAVETLNGNSDEVVLENSGTMSSEPFSASNTENGTTEAVQVLTMDSSFSENNLGVGEDNACRKADIPERNSLDFDEFNSASEMEVLGMERLKLELQTRGLKCGGTLQERAARLFLLKTTPLDKIPKKHLAKK